MCLTLCLNIKLFNQVYKLDLFFARLCQYVFIKTVLNYNRERKEIEQVALTYIFYKISGIYALNYLKKLFCR